MSNSHTALLASLFAGALATVAFAQDSTMAAAVDCDAQFTALDIDGNGFLSEAEAPREHARARVNAVTLDANGLSKEALLIQCGDAQWIQAQIVEGAPFEGANSFTEAQARDRATSWNVNEVSTLVLDEKGIWRGMGKMDAVEVSVAVDYKGNVITAPKN